jgi:hypothetical protein
MQEPINLPLPEELKCDCAACKSIKEQIRKLIIKENGVPRPEVMGEILKLREQLCEWQRVNRGDL